MTWRENYADQNLRMAQKMLEQQGEVNQLRARLAEVEAERDAARRRVELMTTAHDGYWAVQKALDDILGPDPDDGAGEGIVADVWLVAKQRDNLAAENARLRQEADHGWREAARLLAQNVAMRPVVEAAEEVPTDVFLSLVADAIAVAKLDRKREFYQAVFDRLQDFDALVDAYRAAQKAPLDRPESRQSQDQAEPAEPDADTYRLPTMATTVRTGTVTWDPPADPPGLDAAIEAGWHAAMMYSIGDLGLDEDDQTDVELGIGAAIRAAAPALRAGALREAAGWIRAEADAEAKRLNATDLKTASDAINNWLLGIREGAKLLDERADRIGGAT